jgi:hypothetical protein
MGRVSVPDLTRVTLAGEQHRFLGQWEIAREAQFVIRTGVPFHEPVLQLPTR